MSSDEDRIARAGDYILGVMDDAERERAERDLERDPAFREAVMRLSVQLHALDRTARPARIPDGMWAAIEARIAEMPQMRAAGATRGNAARRSPRRRGRMRWLSPASLGGWRGALVAAGLVLACGVGYLAGVEFGPAPRPVVIVVLDTDDQTPGAIVEAYADDSVRIVPLEDFVVPEGKILEVWTLYDQAVGPVSLGTLQQAAETRITGPRLPTPRPEQLYEITLEDAPRSPTGRPTGPILVKGFAKRPAGR
jgi:anti-sigma-K factor RskA